MDLITTPVQVITLPSDRIVHETDADLVSNNYPSTVTFVQYDDTLPVLAVRLLSSGNEYVLPSGAACNIRILKQDGTTVYLPATGCDSARSTAYFEISDDMTDVPGQLESTIEVVVNNAVAGTSPLNIVIDQNPVQRFATLASTLGAGSIEPITVEVQEITISSEKILHRANVDLVGRNVPDVIRVVQYDRTLPVLEINISEAGVAYPLPENSACNIRIRKPDGKVIYNPALGCDSTRTIVYFDVTNQMTTTEGDMPGIVEIIVGAKFAGTSPFVFRVEKNPVDNDSVISEDEVQTLTELAGQATEAAEAAEEAASTASMAASTATTAAGQASTSASTASTAASTATTAASTATTATQTATTKAGEASSSASAAAQSAQEAAASAAMLDAEKILGNFATYQETLTASKAYKVGDFLTYNGNLYRVTTAIASGGTISPGTNCVQTTVGNEVANNCLVFENVTVSATTGDIATITDARITADHVVAECVWGDASAITTDVTCTTSVGSLVLNGDCTTATTVTLTLVKKCN